MALPKSVDLDRLVDEALKELSSAIRWWVQGWPRDEVALMNHVTGRLSRRRHRCDVGTVRPVTIETQLAPLHRQGTNQTDRFGSDLAVTVSIPDDGFLKTCFLQFKKSGGDYKITVERRQLDDAVADGRIGDRAFITVADEVRGGIRQRLVKDVRSGWRSGQASRSFDAAEWDGLVVWLYRWLKCDVGPVSTPTDQDRVEGLLEPYFLSERPGRDERELNLPDGVFPARSWLRLEFTVGRGESIGAEQR